MINKYNEEFKRVLSNKLTPSLSRNRFWHAFEFNMDFWQASEEGPNWRATWLAYKVLNTLQLSKKMTSSYSSPDTIVDCPCHDILLQYS